MQTPEIEVLQARLLQVESALAHHQYEYDALNQVVIQQAAQIERLQRQLSNFESSLKSVEQLMPGEKSDLADEKPPHY